MAAASRPACSRARGEGPPAARDEGAVAAEDVAHVEARADAPAVVLVVGDTPADAVVQAREGSVAREIGRPLGDLVDLPRLHLELEQGHDDRRGRGRAAQPLSRAQQAAEARAAERDEQRAEAGARRRTAPREGDEQAEAGRREHEDEAASEGAPARRFGAHEVVEAVRGEDGDEEGEAEEVLGGDPPQAEAGDVAGEEGQEEGAVAAREQEEEQGAGGVGDPQGVAADREHREQQGDGAEVVDGRALAPGAGGEGVEQVQRTRGRVDDLGETELLAHGLGQPREGGDDARQGQAHDDGDRHGTGGGDPREVTPRGREAADHEDERDDQHGGEADEVAEEVGRVAGEEGHGGGCPKGQAAARRGPTHQLEAGEHQPR
ncbi:hypothetical protein OV079_04425 [Nannocystis pusilla]|uniref:Uncharacterized protein n=1 Tax=Nannocystis pusilla TaxID=889268 RepID=A0A9X3EKG5_9BACT|nr:hypothetical protein [Nannocystis pusilla]MCY1004830.1 hypothetical protein [Nannocystis pusilla]